MKNLKRALSFAVAAVMLVGMMAIGTSAFTDDASIENTTAVNVMNQLGIINGKPDGSFDPTATVSRAEMAKMICVALNGGKDPVLDTDATSYPDTVGNWAAGYIEYCTNLGIVAGSTDGNFYPGNPVTGTEAAKMLLIAIGYSAENEKFVNNKDWSTNINVVANKKDLYEDVAVLPTNPLSRDNAAQMIYNAMYATMVEYEYQLNSVGGELTSVAVAKDKAGAPNIMNSKFNLYTVAEGLLTDVEYKSKDDNYAIEVDGVELGRVENDYSALFMQKVTVLASTKGTASTADDTIFGLYAIDSEVLVSTTYTNVTALTGTIEIDDVEYEFDATAPVYAFLNDVHNAPAAEWAATLVDNDDDGKANVVVVYPTTVAQVTFVGSKNVIVGTNNWAYEDKEVKLYDGIAEDDWTVVVAGVYTVDGDAVVTKADVVTGKVEAVKNTTDVKVGGEWLERGTGYTGPATLTIGTEYDITVVNGYYYAASAVEEEFTASNMLYVMAYDAAAADNGLNKGTQKAKVMFSDGTTAVVTVDKIDSKGVTAATYNLGADVNAYGLYTFKTDKDGNYELTDVDPTDYAATFNSTVNFVDGKADNGYRFNADAVIWFVDTAEDEVSVISGADVNKWDDETGIAAKLLGEKKSGFGYVQVGLMTAAAVPGATKDTGYGMVVAAPYVVEIDDTEYVQLTVWNGTENVEVVYEGNDDTVVAKGDMISFDLSDGEITNVAFVGAIGAVTAYDGTYITVDCLPGEYEITEDSVIIYVDSDKVVGVESGKIQLAHKDTNGSTLVNNVYAAGVDAKNEIAVLFVDVTNEWA